MSEAPIVYDVTLTSSMHLRYTVTGAASAHEALRFAVDGDPRAVEVLGVNGERMISEPMATASPRVLDGSARIVFFLLRWLLAPPGER